MVLIHVIRRRLILKQKLDVETLYLQVLGVHASARCIRKTLGKRLDASTSPRSTHSPSTSTKNVQAPERYTDGLYALVSTLLPMLAPI